MPLITYVTKVFCFIKISLCRLSYVKTRYLYQSKLLAALFVYLFTICEKDLNIIIYEDTLRY